LAPRNPHRDSPLEITDSLAKLFSLVRIGNGFIECALGETDHLRGDTDSAFVKDVNGDLKGGEALVLGRGKGMEKGYLVAFANLSDDVSLGDLDVVKAQQAGRRSLDSELRINQIKSVHILMSGPAGSATHLLLLFRNRHPHLLVKRETGDPLVAL
jgi:hypothetical protein